MKSVPALILAGGSGTRLRSVLPDLPKPLAPVLGRPFITFLLDQLLAAGVTRAVLCIGYKAELMRSTLGTTYGPLTLQYSEETEPLGTGGALRLALPLIQEERFYLLNGDSLCDASLSEFYAFHASHGKPASLVSVELPDSSRYGQLELEAGGRIKAFKEKQPSAASGWINAGIYLLETALVAGISEGKSISLERDLFPQWLNLEMMAWKVRTQFIDIGTPESYAEVPAFLKKLNPGAKPEPQSQPRTDRG